MRSIRDVISDTVTLSVTDPAVLRKARATAKAVHTKPTYVNTPSEALEGFRAQLIGKRHVRLFELPDNHRYPWDVAECP